MARESSRHGRWLSLYEFFPRLVALARARGAGSDAEDVASTVLIRVWEKTGVSPEPGWPYLARSVVNEVSDRHRRMCRERTLTERMCVRADTSSVEDRVIASIEARRLLAVLAENYPSPTLTMIRLRIAGSTWSEIAARFGKPASTVQARVRRALRAVRPAAWSSGAESA